MGLDVKHGVNDTRFMREALRLAKKGLGRTSPNPPVGAVIVRHGRIISAGYHHEAGQPHAEIEALNKLGGRAPGDTLYVTLEPCNHQGKTPPCTASILKSGVKEVVVGMKDPNPNISGGGCEFLKKKGIDVRLGILELECRKLNEAFIKFVSTERPFVIVKSAQTLDGWTATVSGYSKWITNDKSRQFVHRLRDQMDAVMVGVGTVIADDPQLTTRLKRGGGKDPLRVVVDTHLRTPLKARVLNHHSTAETLLVVGPNIPGKDIKRFQKDGVSTVVCPTKADSIDLSALMDILGKKSVSSLLVEGGASIIGSLIRERLVDKFYIFKAARILGGDDGVPMAAGPGPKNMDQSLVLRDVETRRFADDILVVGYPDY